MSHFAKVENGIVTQVIVAEQDVIDSGAFGQGWIQTSYNTHENQHHEGRPLRANFAGIGYIYDIENDVFYAPKPFASWILNNTKWIWEAPIPLPNDDKYYVWDEEKITWSEVIIS